MIGYNPIYEYAALPDVQRIVAAIRKSISMKQQRPVAAAVSAAEADERRAARRAPTAAKSRSRGRRPRLQIHRALRCRSWAKEFAQPRLWPF